MHKFLIIPLILIFTFITNVNSATVKIGTATIESAEIKSGTDTKKTKLTLKEAKVNFEDGSIYVGPLRKNKLHGKGKLTLPDGTVYEGKFKSNKFTDKISRKNRTLIKVNLKKGIKVENQMKVKGLNKWYPAKVVGGEFQLTKKGQLMASQDKQSEGSGGGSGGGGGGC